MSRYRIALLGLLVSTIGDIGMMTAKSLWTIAPSVLIAAIGVVIVIRGVDYAYYLGRSDDAHDWTSRLQVHARNGSATTPPAAAPSPATSNAK